MRVPSKFGEQLEKLGEQLDEYMYPVCSNIWSQKTCNEINKYQSQLHSGKYFLQSYSKFSATRTLRDNTMMK